MIRKRRTIQKNTREEVIKRDGLNCKHCGKEGLREDWYGKVRIVEKEFYKKWINVYDETFELSHKIMHFNHTIPLFRNGSNEKDNVQILCKKCNLKKGYKLEEELCLEKEL